ncbi:MAG: TonB-dependent receptor [Sphingomonadaceae bacterium]|uniref:TonB-dependent receptor n=1 Tax=Thermaurantiacus sp. TaxID=2820283 RepID=UPI00298EE036|nr:TonB-dependent receptor [Thermaurantiacus sp.]MCS6986494.1 TonB-dependent receptor [Sphingomonadaceae bacterium]MDW8414245.1 TonB-dependent receptor [Thermaurantiacus sp.]
MTGFRALMDLTGFRALMLSGAALVAGPVVAQTAETPALEDIVVTATRRAESIQDVPVSVSAIPPTQLAAAAAPDIRDLVGRTPNLVIDPVGAGPSAAAISIRGISFEDIEKSFDPAVGVLIDGVYLGTNTGQLLDFFDFERVEVLRGPQGTLFGRNTTAGVINIQRTRPTGELGMRVLGTIGNYGRRDLRAVVNTPEILGGLSAKLFWLHAQNEDFYTNRTLGEDYGGRNYDNYGVAVRLRRGPLDMILTYERVEERTETDTTPLGRTGVDLICAPIPGLPPGFLPPRDQCDRTTEEQLYETFTNVPSLVRNDGDNFTANIEIDGGIIQVTSVTGYRTSDESVRQDFDSTSINFFDTLRIQEYKQFTQELRFSGDATERINYVLGVFYFWANYKLDQTTFFGRLLQTLARLPPQGGNRVDHYNTSVAIFGDVQWRITDRLRLSLGGRYNWDDKNYTNDYLKTGLPQFIAKPSASWTRFQPRASIDYRFSEGNLAYFTYARGYRAGGFNGRGQTAFSANTPYDPETVDSYEAGLKTTWLDGRLSANVAAFLTKYDDKQEEVVRPAPPPAGQETIVANAASATIWGVEAEFRALPFDRVNLWGSVGYLDAGYDEFTTIIGGQVVDISSRTMRRTPKWSLSVGGDWTVPLEPVEVNLSASYRYVGAYQTTIIGAWFDPRVNDPRGLADARHLLDASAAVYFNLGKLRTRAAIFGRNILNDKGLSAALPVAGLFTFGTGRPLRTFGGEIGFEF